VGRPESGKGAGGPKWAKGGSASKGRSPGDRGGDGGETGTSNEGGRGKKAAKTKNTGRGILVRPTGAPRPGRKGGKKSVAGTKKQKTAGQPISFEGELRSILSATKGASRGALSSGGTSCHWGGPRLHQPLPGKLNGPEQTIPGARKTKQKFRRTASWECGAWVFFGGKAGLVCVNCGEASKGAGAGRGL